MNDLAVLKFSDEDRNQFAQLIGYSVSGYADLSYANEKHIEQADLEVDRLIKQRNDT